MIARRLLHDRRGSVALWIGLSLPTLLMALGLGIEVASWSVSTLELQRTADAAALAGAMNYSQTSNGQSATGAAANLAEVNGVAGAATRSWNAGTKTLSDNNITAAVVSGIKNAGDTAIKVTVQQNVPLTFSRVVNALGSVNVSATAWSELVTNAGTTGPQPCLVALKTAAAGGTGINMSGSVNFQDPNCSIRSNASIALTNGSGVLNTGGIYAGGNISIPPWVSVTGTEFPTDGTISDPYQSDAALQAALAQLSPGAGSALSAQGTYTISPGHWSSWNLGNSTNITMNPGLYIVNGPITIGGSTLLTGHGVTIISSGSITANTGSFTGNLTAPGTAPSGGGVPGILMASTGSSVVFSASYNLPFTGVLYFPNASVTVSGSSNLGSPSCSELITGSITIAGSTSFSGNCSSLGAPSFGSLPATSTVSLVQ